MERIGQLEPRISVLAEDFNEEALEALEADAGKAQAAVVSCSPWTHSQAASQSCHSLPKTVLLAQ